jgi:hypothetical protein
MLLAVPVLAWHCIRRKPVSAGLLLICGRRFSLPAAGRYDLAAGRDSLAGRFWVELVFDGDPPARLLVLRDQLDAQGWRRLRLAVAESA